LEQIILRPGIERRFDVRLSPLAGVEENWRFGVKEPNLPAQFDTIAIEQLQVEQNQLIAIVAGFFQAFCRRRHRFNLIMIESKNRLHQLTGILIIIYTKNYLLVRHVCHTSPILPYSRLIVSSRMAIGSFANVSP